MRCEITIVLKELRLHGMVNAWMDLTAQGESAIASSKWLIEHLLKAENADRALRSISYQLKSARFPIHRDLAKFDFAVSSVDEDLVKTLATMTFTDTAQNVVFIGGPGTGKTHLATAIAVSGITSKGMRVSVVIKFDGLIFKFGDGRQGKTRKQNGICIATDAVGI